VEGHPLHNEHRLRLSDNFLSLCNSQTLLGFTIVHPPRCGDPRQGDRVCIGEEILDPTQSAVNPAHMVSPAGVRGGTTPSCLWHDWDIHYHSYPIRLCSATDIMRACIRLS